MVVPTLNNARTLRRCLEALRRQSRRPDELIVVDAGSSDATPEIAQELAELVVSPIANRCYQNNLGARTATGDFLLFLDADMITSIDVVAEALARISEAGSPQALVLPEVSIGTTFFARAKAFERTFYQGIWWLEALRWLPSDLFWSVGGFDTSMTGTEDWDLDQRVRDTAHVGWLTAVTFHEEGELHLRDLAARKAHYSVTFERFAEKFPARAQLAMGIVPRAKLFARQPRRLLAHPILSAGVAVMGLAEVGATRGWFRTQDPWPEERPVDPELRVIPDSPK